MKKLIAILFSVTVLAGVISGCIGAAPVTYTDSAKSIETSVGGQFTMVLEGNRTTGYAWEASFDEVMLKLVKSEYKVNEAPKGMVGVPGKEYFTFQAVKSGQTQITFVYKRSFETEIAEQKVFSVNIK